MASHLGQSTVKRSRCARFLARPDTRRPEPGRAYLQSTHTTVVKARPSWAICWVPEFHTSVPTQSTWHLTCPPKDCLTRLRTSLYLKAQPLGPTMWSRSPSLPSKLVDLGTSSSALDGLTLPRLLDIVYIVLRALQRETRTASRFMHLVHLDLRRLPTRLH